MGSFLCSYTIKLSRDVYTVYVLYSEQHKKIYVGCTSNLKERFKSHNELGRKGWTIKFRPWTVIHKEDHRNIADALKREKELKTAAGRRWIWDLISSIHS